MRNKLSYGWYTCADSNSNRDCNYPTKVLYLWSTNCRPITSQISWDSVCWTWAAACSVYVFQGQQVVRLFFNCSRHLFEIAMEYCLLWIKFQTCMSRILTMSQNRSPRRVSGGLNDKKGNQHLIYATRLFTGCHGFRTFSLVRRFIFCQHMNYPCVNICDNFVWT